MCNLNIDSISQWVSSVLNAKQSFNFLDQQAHEFVQFVAICCDQIWMLRNKAIREQLAISPHQVAREINKVFHQHLQAWESVTPLRFLHTHWSPPSPPFLKINFNTAVCDNYTCQAALCRNYLGDILFSRTTFDHPRDTSWVEAKGALLAVTKG